MTKTLLLNSFLILLVSASAATAQFDIPEINKLKEIRMLESTAFDVQRLLFDLKTDGWDPLDHEQWFYTENFSIDVYYSSGNCSDDDEIWNAAEWKVRRIEINPLETLKTKDLGFDFSKFKNEQVWNYMPNTVVYYDKEKGIAFEVNKKEGEIEEIYLFASKSSQSKPCENETAKEFLKYESWFGSKKLEDRLQGDSNLPPNVTELTLSESEIPLGRYNKQVKVSTEATDPENDVLTYNYTVSGGKIIGSGANVIWDLRGVEHGTYSVTVGVDDGCGICGKTMTKTVTIR